MITVANRLQHVEEYYFSKKLKEVAFLKSQGKPIINLGIGSPDLDPPLSAVKALELSLQHAGAHKYQSYHGIPEFRNAVVRFYSNQYQVDLDEKRDVLPLMGSKEGIMHISMAFLNRGDKVLIPNPGYPTYASVTKLVEAEPVYYDLTEDSGWLPKLDTLERMDLSAVKLMWINYPNMPTGTNASDAFYEAIIDFGKRHNILIVNDNPYSFILNSTPKSIMQYPDAKATCLELNSISKTFNMAGWRAGMVVGNSEYINAVLKVKSNMDSGMFYGIQKGAVEALKSSKLWFESLNSIYRGRQILIRTLATALGCTSNAGTTGLFVWAKLPESETSSVAFADRVLEHHNIFIAPGIIFGSNGEGYVRFSICQEEDVIKKAIQRVK